MEWSADIELAGGLGRLRPLTINDADLHLAGEDDEMARFLSGGVSTMETVQNYLNDREAHWATGGPVYGFGIENAVGELVGVTELATDFQRFEGLKSGEANLSYGIYPWARRQGFATAAVIAMSEFARRVGVRRIVIRINNENESSLKVARRAGYQEVGTVVNERWGTLRVFHEPLTNT